MWDATLILWALYLLMPSIVLLQFVFFQVGLRLLFLARSWRSQ